MMWHWGADVPWWEWLLAALPVVVFWALTIGATWYAATTAIRQPNRQPHKPTGPKRQAGRKWQQTLTMQGANSEARSLDAAGTGELLMIRLEPSHARQLPYRR